MLQLGGGPDMTYLYEHVGKVVDEDTYEMALEKIRAGITGQTNDAMMKFKLFTLLGQGNQPFSI